MQVTVTHFPADNSSRREQTCIQNLPEAKTTLHAARLLCAFPIGSLAEQSPYEAHGVIGYCTKEETVVHVWLPDGTYFGTDVYRA